MVSFQVILGFDDFLINFHYRSESFGSLRLLLHYAPADGLTQWPWISGCLCCSAIHQALVVVRVVAFSGQLSAERPGVGHELSGFSGGHKIMFVLASSLQPELNWSAS